MAPSKNLTDRFTVLVADHAIDAALLASRLDRQQYQFVCCRRPDEILLHTQNQSFNLIVLSDDKNAPELIKSIRNTRGVNSETPAIAAMAEEDLAQRKRLLAAGFDDCLKKSDLDKRMPELVEYWQDKQNSATALHYIRIIHNKTKHNRHLTLTIFNKLFEELPRQIEIIEAALKLQRYDVAEETVHKLHGSASFCALEEIRKPAFALENCLMNKNYATANPCCLILREQVLNFISRQTSILANLHTFNE